MNDHNKNCSSLVAEPYIVLSRIHSDKMWHGLTFRLLWVGIVALLGSDFFLLPRDWHETFGTCQEGYKNCLSVIHGLFWCYLDYRFGAEVNDETNKRDICDNRVFNWKFIEKRCFWFHVWVDTFGMMAGRLVRLLEVSVNANLFAKFTLISITTACFFFLNKKRQFDWNL